MDGPRSLLIAARALDWLRAAGLARSKLVLVRYALSLAGASRPGSSLVKRAALEAERPGRD
jgi:hypothetical protein